MNGSKNSISADARLKSLFSKILRSLPLKIVFGIVVIVFPFMVKNAYLNYICTLIMLTSISALGYNFISGFAGTFILSQAAFAGVGAYCSAYLSMNWNVPVLVGVVVGACVACAIGYLLSLPTQRLSSTFLTLATLAFNQTMFIVFQNATPFTGGPYGIKDIPKPGIIGSNVNNAGYYILVLVVLVLSYIVIKRLLISKVGRVMFSISVDPDVGMAMGINVGKYRTFAFCVAAFMGGLSGALQAHFITYTFANNYKIDESIVLLSMIALGGLASLEGSIVGPAIFTFVNLYFAQLYDYRLLICGTMLIVIVIIRPKGLMGGKPIGMRKKSLEYINSLNIAKRDELCDSPQN